MAALFFCKTDPYYNRYHIEGQVLKSSVRRFSTCPCFLELSTYKDKECITCGNPVKYLNWNDICDFMIYDLHREDISMLLSCSCFLPLTPEIADTLSIHKIKSFNRYIDSNAFIIADKGDGKFKLFAFTKYEKKIINKNNTIKTIDEIELTSIKYDHEKTILTPNWNLEKNLWLPKI